ncbi:MAG: hypothetical protein FJX76_09550 [Armatimonadetes bacterium]|nr:hypothetical protein [Armatimonadota bacterium]
MQVAINYSTGWASFNGAQFGESIVKDYWGKGTPPDVTQHARLERGIDLAEEDDLNVLSGQTHTISGRETYANVYVAPGGTLTCDTPNPELNVLGDFDFYGAIDVDSTSWARTRDHSASGRTSGSLICRRSFAGSR